MDISYEDDHEAFAGSRVNQYVYVPTKDTFFSALDQHADTLDGDVKPPLVILGDEGSGKTALFANWLAKRREHRHRDEFLFQHYVGCSKESFQLSQMLLRLETALKDFFQLREMIVPETEVELRWSLGRFLAAAAKKYSPARIVIIIDGVHQLECEGAATGALHWLPIDLPPCVRFMVSTVEQDKLSTGGNGLGATSATATNPTAALNLNTAVVAGAQTPGTAGGDRGVTGASSNSGKSKMNSTYVELSRRGYPLLNMEPLGMPTRHNIISAFLHMNPGQLSLAENQQYKIVTAPATAQPLFLRSLLQSLKLASSMSAHTIDELIDIFLPCSTAYELIDKNFEVCFDGSNEHEDARDYLGKVSSVVYFSRNGLTEEEIWGLVRMLTKSQPDESVKSKIYSFLTAYTMIVAGMHSFSHAIYKDVVFARYIQSKGEGTRWHYAMARFFSQLPPCDRKLQALPYHLGEAGSWSRVKNCLTDIDMFQLWWTTKFKKDFLKTWAQLTAREGTKKKTDAAGAGGAAATATEEVDEGSKKKRPTYDVVEEYVKSLDEFRNQRHPSDEEVANIILQIADFLMEFAILGYEQAADVPASIHPTIPSEDLMSQGVPHVVVEDGRFSLMYPRVFRLFQSSDEKTASEAPMAIEDMPLCTTYFFHRWMWIQFPYVALGNCGSRYLDGVNKMKDANSLDGQTKQNRSLVVDKKPATAAETRAAMSKSWNVASFNKLPALTFNRKAAKSIPRVVHVDKEEDAPDKVALRLFKLQEDISNYREECDFIVNMKGGLNKRLQELRGTIEELRRAGESCHDVDKDLNAAITREADASKKFANCNMFYKNLHALMVMCERHPPNVPALITEIQLKLEQDKILLAEIKNRLWEQKFERQTHNSCFKQMRLLAKEGAEMHNKLLEYRYAMKKSLTEQAAEDQRRLASRNKSRTDPAIRNGNSSKLGGKSGFKEGKMGEESMLIDQSSPEARAQQWQSMWNVVSQRTGITEPEIFFARLNNSGALLEQINSLKRNSEVRAEQLKREVVSVEAELEEVRLESSYTGGLSTKEKHKELAEKTQKVRRSKERAETAEQLLQRVYSGFNHICEVLGVPPREEGAPVVDLIRDVETVLDSLLEEKEKQHQMGQQNNAAAAAAAQLVSGGALDGQAPTQQGSRMINGRDTNMSPEITHRPPELEAALSKFESNKKRTAKIRTHSARLDKSGTRTGMNSTTFGMGSVVQKGPDSDEDDPENFDDEGTWNRKFVKAQSQRSVRLKQREESKKVKQAAEAAAAAANTGHGHGHGHKK